jgi:hypothetical protein
VAIINYVARAIATARYRSRTIVEPDGPHEAKRWRWIVTPACVLVLLTALTWNWPLRLRFAASRSALEAAAKQYAGAPAYTKIGRRAGLFYLQFLRSSGPNEVCFVVGDSGIDPIGFAYRPDDPRPNDPGRLAPCWYVEEW